MTGSYRKPDGTIDLNAPMPSLPAAPAPTPRVATPALDHETRSHLIRSQAEAIGQALRASGASMTADDIASEFGMDVDRLGPALRLAVEDGKVIKSGTAYRARVASVITGFRPGP